MDLLGSSVRRRLVDTLRQRIDGPRGTRHLVRNDLEARERTRSEGSNDCHIGGIATARHQNAPDTRRVVASIERVPAPAEIDLKPGAEIHRIRIGRHANVAKITGAIARRNVHAAAQGDCEMGKISTDATAFHMCIPRRLGRIRMLIAECKVAVYVVANSLNERPSLPHIAKFGPGEVHETIRLAIPAAKEIDERLDRELFQSVLLSIRRYVVGLAAVVDQKIREQSKPAPWGVYDVANIAETVA